MGGEKGGGKWGEGGGGGRKTNVCWCRPLSAMKKKRTTLGGSRKLRSKDPLPNSQRSW